MRALPFLALLALPIALPAQAIVVPIGCGAPCPRSDRPNAVLEIASVDVSVILGRGQGTTYVSHVIRNHLQVPVEGAFFFPIPRGATVERTWVQEGQQLQTYNEWSPPAESRKMMQEILRDRPRSHLRAYAGMEVAYVHLPPIAPGGVKNVQIGYRQAPVTEGGQITYTYPLSYVSRHAPAGRFALVMTINTPHGFTELRSSSHDVDIQPGSEMARCPPQAACGFRGVPSERQKIVRLRDAPRARARDFVLV